MVSSPGFSPFYLDAASFFSCFILFPENSSQQTEGKRGFIESVQENSHSYLVILLRLPPHTSTPTSWKKEKKKKPRNIWPVFM